MPRKSSFNPGSIPARWDEPDSQVDALLAAKLSRPTVRAINVPIAHPSEPLSGAENIRRPGGIGRRDSQARLHLAVTCAAAEA